MRGRYAQAASSQQQAGGSMRDRQLRGEKFYLAYSPLQCSLSPIAHITDLVERQ